VTVIRSSPDVGYINPAIMSSIGVSHVVRAHGFAHFSGIVAADAQLNCVAPGNIRAQAVHVLATLKKLLAAEGLGFADVVSTTVYTTDVGALAEHAHLFAEAHGDHHPASTWLEIRALARPEFLLELVVIAAYP